MKQQDEMKELSPNETENIFGGGWVLLIYRENGKRIVEYTYEVD